MHVRAADGGRRVVCLQRPVGQVHKKERHVLELPQLQSLKARAPAANDDVDTVARFDLLFGE